MGTLGRMTMMKVFYVMVVCMVVFAPYGEGTALTCGDVVNKLAPCLNYLKTGGTVPPTCCKGVTGLNSIAKTSQEKRTACVCMKSAYKSYTGIKPENALTLPHKCGVEIPYKISLETDCTKVK